MASFVFSRLHANMTFNSQASPCYSLFPFITLFTYIHRGNEEGFFFKLSANIFGESAFILIDSHWKQKYFSGYNKNDERGKGLLFPHIFHMSLLGLRRIQAGVCLL